MYKNIRRYTILILVQISRKYQLFLIFYRDFDACFLKIRKYMSIYLCDFIANKLNITHFWISSYRKFDERFPKSINIGRYIIVILVQKSRKYSISEYHYIGHLIYVF